MEKIYIGTKIIAAEKMDEFTYLASKVQSGSAMMHISEVVKINPDGKGRPGYKVRYEDGYVSWSPKETFERAYRKVTPDEKIMVLREAMSKSPTGSLGKIDGFNFLKTEEKHLDRVFSKENMPKDMENPE